MKTYILNERPFSFDETRAYRDFYVQGTEQCLCEVCWEELLRRLESGDASWDAAVARSVLMLSRWVHEAPRKRFYRKLALEGGVAVVSGEQFFIQTEEGDQIIDGLEASGQVAAALCRHYGLEPLEPIRHDTQEPVQEKDLVPGDLEDKLE
jgi:hypothetical protein